MLKELTSQQFIYKHKQVQVVIEAHLNIQCTYKQFYPQKQTYTCILTELTVSVDHGDMWALGPSPQVCRGPPATHCPSGKKE